MTRLLDARSSQNASIFGIMSEPFAFDPESYAQVGLNIINPVGIIRVQFFTTITVEIPAGSGSIAVLIDIVRGTLPTDTLAYSAGFIEGNNTENVTRAFSVNGADYNVPAPANNLLVYTAFVRCPDDVTLTRVGPESFEATACDD